MKSACKKFLRDYFQISSEYIETSSIRTKFKVFIWQFSFPFLKKKLSRKIAIQKKKYTNACHNFFFRPTLLTCTKSPQKINQKLKKQKNERQVPWIFAHVWCGRVYHYALETLYLIHTFLSVFSFAFYEKWSLMRNKEKKKKLGKSYHKFWEPVSDNRKSHQFQLKWRVVFGSFHFHFLKKLSRKIAIQKKKNTNACHNFFPI